jgi:hypothetical protein
VRLTGMSQQDHATTDRRFRGRRARQLAPLAAALLAVIVVTGTALAIRAGDRSHSSAADAGVPVLHLSPPGVDGPTQARPPDGTLTGPYVLTGSLPTGQPSHAPSFRFAGGQAPVELVRRVAAALGLSGTPTREGPGWRLVASGRELSVQDGPGWAWQLNDFVGRRLPNTVCVPAPCPGPQATDEPRDPVRGLRAPTLSSAQHAAAKALQRLGLPADAMRTSWYGSTAEVRARRTAGGGEAAGLDTVLVVGGDDRIRTGSGYLGTPANSRSYPIITAAAAFAQLRGQPGPLMPACRADCPATGPQRVTGAHLGSMVTSDERGALLVPAWLFTVAGQAQPVPVVAVEPRYLAGGSQPAPIKPRSGISVPGKSVPGKSVPGNSVPADAVPPTAPRK